jgi:hypothetical protein
MSMSTLAGWQRGGWLSERLIWATIGVLLVAGAHLLPALCRSESAPTRFAAYLLWAACMLTTCYGHATFFLNSEQHAGEARAAELLGNSVSPMQDKPDRPGRGLTQVAADRARVVTALAAANGRRCPRECTALRVERDSLAAQLDALDVEASEMRRQEADDDRRAAASDLAEKQRDDARSDPVASRVAAFLGVQPATVDVSSGLAFAGVLEGVACLLWLVALGEPTGASAGEPVTARDSAVVTASHELVTGTDCAAAHDADVTGLISDIAAGRLRATVADIRRHLGCSQSRAITLRRRLAAEQ